MQHINLQIFGSIAVFLEQNIKTEEQIKDFWKSFKQVADARNHK